jgi:hypothetical protein
MCDEIIRAFPSAVDNLKPKWQNAAEVLTSFDYIYSTEDYANTIGPVYRSLELPVPSMIDLLNKDNIRAKEPDLDTAAHISEAMLASDDWRLYSLILPSVGVRNAGLLIAERLNVERKREKIVGKAIYNPDHGMVEIDYESLFNLLGYELHLLGDTKKNYVIECLRKRKDNLDNLLSYLESRNY